MSPEQERAVDYALTSEECHGDFQPCYDPDNDRQDWKDAPCWHCRLVIAFRPEWVTSG